MKMRKMAVQLVGSLSTKFDPSKYTDDYRKAMLDVITAKLEGQEITVPAQEKRRLLIMEAKASLALAEKKQREQGSVAGKAMP